MIHRSGKASLFLLAAGLAVLPPATASAADGEVKEPQPQEEERLTRDKIAAMLERYALGHPGLDFPGTVKVVRRTLCLPQVTARVGSGDSTKEGGLTETWVTEREVSVLTPNRFRTELKAASLVSESDLPGLPATPAASADSLLKVAVLGEWQDGAWTTIREDGAALSDPQKQSLMRSGPLAELDDSTTLYGSSPHSMTGEIWQVPSGKLSTFAGIDHPEGILEGSLVKVIESGGTACAEIRFTYDLTGIAAGHAEWKIHAKGSAVVHRSLMDLIDFDGQYTADIEVTGSTAEGVPLEIKGSMTLEETGKILSSRLRPTANLRAAVMKAAEGADGGRMRDVPEACVKTARESLAKEYAWTGLSAMGEKLPGDHAYVSIYQPAFFEHEGAVYSAQWIGFLCPFIVKMDQATGEALEQGFYTEKNYAISNPLRTYWQWQSRR